MLEFPIEQHTFKPRTWMKARKKMAFDKEFCDLSPADIVDIRNVLCETTKVQAKVYMEDIYKLIIRWCNDEPTVTDSESDGSLPMQSSKVK